MYIRYCIFTIVNSGDGLKYKYSKFRTTDIPKTRELKLQ